MVGLLATPNAIPVPFPARGEDCFDGSGIRRWPHIIFQVFWHPSAENQKECIVLLGEAAAPAVTSLGSRPSSFRLKLSRFKRRAPRNSISYEDWYQRFYNTWRRQKAAAADDFAQEERGLEQADTERAAYSRDCELKKLQEAMKQAFGPARIPNLVGASSAKSNLGSNQMNTYSDASTVDSLLRTPRPLGDKERDTPPKTSAPHSRNAVKEGTPLKEASLDIFAAECFDYEAQSRNGILGSSFTATRNHEKGTTNLSMLRLTDGSYVRLPAGPASISSHHQGIPIHSKSQRDGIEDDSIPPCYLDVDLAWEADRDSRLVNAVGSLRVDLHSVLVPICGNEGSLRVRVCEVETPFSSMDRASASSSARPLPWMPRVDAAGMLARCMENLDREVPTLPTVNPLWVSPFSRVGYKSSGEPSEDLVEWTDSVILPVSQSSVLLQRRHMGLLRDAMEPLPAPEHPVHHDPIKVDFDWKPVQLPAAAPMPRCRERLQPSAFFEPEHNPWC